MQGGLVNPAWSLVGTLFKTHPWHGIPIGPKAPHICTAFIEMVPTDTVKFEIDKVTGHLRLDRPQRYSNVCPAMYGFLPQTYCGENLAKLTREHTRRTSIVGDGDPLDICVLTEKDISHGEITCNVIPIGGLRMLDGNEADDKIIAVLDGDAVYGGLTDLTEAPLPLIVRLKHYFLTYKQSPENPRKDVEIVEVYRREAAHEVIHATRLDYRERYRDLENCLAAATEKR
ncbi:MAG: inorganic pyrophosphatase [Candidatus Sumerlaeia bacterium]|nr:inorganic pyrophosphatase [Candidatus Sumerlaeia bacterium]